MKRGIGLVLWGVVCGLFISLPAGAEDVSNYELNQRVRQLEEKMGSKGGAPGWTDRIAISGRLEAEAGFSSQDFDNRGAEDVDESDIVLATVELGIDARIHEHVSAHVLFLWEEDDTDPVDMDEGYLRIDGKDALPLYLQAGKFYLPFGNFESHMISDPVTLELGETNQSAVQAGFVNDWIATSVTIFNGDVDESGEDNLIDSYVGSLQFSLPQNTVAHLGLSAGAAYISNLADSDVIQDLVDTADGTIEDHVAAWGAFVSVSFRDMVFLEAEYIGALDKFRAGELSIDGGEAVEPSAWNLELAYAPLDNLQVALRYAQTDDIKGGIEAADAFPETQYGATLAYDLFDSTTLALEYLKGEFENDDQMSLVTFQLAAEF